MVLIPQPPSQLTDREQDVMNWLSEVVDGNIKLGDKIAEILGHLKDLYDNEQPQ